MLTIQIPTPQDPEEAAAWVTKFVQALPEGLWPTTPASTATATLDRPAGSGPDGEETLDDALVRFQGNWQRYAGRFMRVHEGLVAIGFQPEWRGSRNYIAYVHPKTGRHFIEMNSSTVYFPAQAKKDEVVGSRDFVTKAGSVRLDGDAQVEFVLEVAEGELG